MIVLPLTHTALNIANFLGALSGVGIFMRDFVGHLLAEGKNLDEALVKCDNHRLCPVLMTSLAAGNGVASMNPHDWLGLSS